MNELVIKKWETMLDIGLITPSEHLLFQKIMELEFENSKLKEQVKGLLGPTQVSNQVINKVDKVSTANLSNKSPVKVNPQPRGSDVPVDHESTIKELCSPLSAKATSKSFRL